MSMEVNYGNKSDSIKKIKKYSKYAEFIMMIKSALKCFDFI